MTTEIERVVLGTRSFSEISENTTFQILEDFFSLGGRYVDTAFLYGNGLSQKTIGKFNKLYNPDACYIAKIGYFKYSSEYTNANKIKEAIDSACTTLYIKPKYVLLHEADWRVWWERGAKISELLNSNFMHSNTINFNYFQIFKEITKKYSLIPGISGNNADIIQLLLSVDPKVILLSKQYDLLWKNGEELALSTHNKFLLLLGAPFHQGWLFRLKELRKKIESTNKQIIELEDIISKNKYDLVHLALNFVWQTAQKAKVVFGVNSSAELHKNLSYLSQAIPARVINKLKKIKVYCPPMPGPIKFGADNDKKHTL